MNWILTGFSLAKWLFFCVLFVVKNLQMKADCHVNRCPKRTKCSCVLKNFFLHDSFLFAVFFFKKARLLWEQTMVYPQQASLNFIFWTRVRSSAFDNGRYSLFNWQAMFTDQNQYQWLVPCSPHFALADQWVGPTFGLKASPVELWFVWGSHVKIINIRTVILFPINFNETDNLLSLVVAAVDALPSAADSLVFFFVAFFGVWKCCGKNRKLMVIRSLLACFIPVKAYPRKGDVTRHKRRTRRVS